MRALNLLGEARVPTANDANESLATFWVEGLSVLDSLDPADVDAFWGKSTAHLTRAERQAEFRILLPPADLAREALLALAGREVRRLEEQARRLWAESDGPMKQQVADWCLFDATPRAESMSRYERSNASEVHRSLKLLFAKRREDANRRASQRKERSTERVSEGAATDCRTERKAVAREVLALLKRRAAKRARVAEVSVSLPPVEESAEPFAMPRALFERMVDTGWAAARENGATDVVPLGSSTGCDPTSVQSHPSTPAAPGKEPGPSGPAEADSPSASPPA